MQMNIFRRNLILTGNFADDKLVWNSVLQATHDAGLTVMTTVKHEFYPQGLSGVIVLAESHVAIHTFPENNQAWLDIATCGNEAQVTRFVGTISKLYKIEEMHT